MKSILFFAMIILLAGCARKNMPAPPRPHEPPAITEVKPAPVMPSAVPLQLKSPQIAAGKTIYTTKCTRCHEAKKTDDWNAQQWVPIIRRMAPKAGLSDTEKANLTAYINMYARKQ